jgi:hypothetical protein
MVSFIVGSLSDSVNDIDDLDTDNLLSGNLKLVHEDPCDSVCLLQLCQA